MTLEETTYHYKVNAIECLAIMRHPNFVGHAELYGSKIRIDNDQQYARLWWVNGAGDKKFLDAYDPAEVIDIYTTVGLTEEFQSAVSWSNDPIWLED